jgi:hypothetical protein
MYEVMRPSRVGDTSVVCRKRGDLIFAAVNNNVGYEDVSASSWGLSHEIAFQCTGVASHAGFRRAYVDHRIGHADGGTENEQEKVYATIADAGSAQREHGRDNSHADEALTREA